MDLTERIEPATVRESGPTHAKIVGTFLKKDAISLNNRLYPAGTVERAVTDAQQRLTQPGALPIQMLRRHGSADTDESLDVVGRITRVWLDGDKAKYEAEVPSTTAGKEMATLVQGGYINSVSLRAEPGSAVVEKGRIGDRDLDVVTEFRLAGVDLTLYPGIRDDARVESIQIFESVPPGDVRTLEETVSEAVWSTARVNDLPDRAFLYIESGGKKDDGGKTTPRSLRHFPFEDENGNVDLPHLRNALGRIPQSTLPEDVKASVTRKAQRIAKEHGIGNDGKEHAMATPTLNERGQHMHAHRHEAPNAFGSMDTYTHEHGHSHDAAGIEHHDALEAHRHEHTAESAAPLANHMHTEAGRAISQVNRDRLAQAHDHIATALGMECAPPDTDGDNDGDESARLRRIIHEAVAAAVSGARTPATSGVAAAPREGGTGQASGGQDLAQLVGIVRQMAEGQAATAKAMTALQESLPKAAAEAAAKVAWRPERKTELSENRDAGNASGAQPQAALRERLGDRRIPVETRLKLASDALAGDMASIQTLSVLQDLVDRAEAAPGR